MLMGLSLDAGCSPASSSVPTDTVQEKTQEQADGPKHFEASGVIRRGRELLLVHDEVDDAYFRLLPSFHVGTGTFKAKGPVRVPFLGRTKAKDLESIALGSGGIYVLSEARSALIGEDASLYLYRDEDLRGGRGLEGLAIRRPIDGAESVAVLFEGGYLKGVEPTDAGPAFALPFVITHRLPSEGEFLDQSEDITARKVVLQLDKLLGSIAKKQRFRAPDLVWFEAPDGSWSWIVLLSSDAPPDKKEKHSYLWLQRFSEYGVPFGEPFDVAAWLKGGDRKGKDHGDWEGLGWWKEGLTFVMVEDSGKRKSQLAFVPIPPSWIATSEHE